MSKKKNSGKNKQKLPLISIAALIVAVAAVIAGAVIILNKWELQVTMNGNETVHVEYGDTYKDRYLLFTSRLLYNTVHSLAVGLVSEFTQQQEPGKS